MQEIKLGKLGIEGFDFKRFNRSGHSGLENTIPNSWVNSWIHTMFHFIPLRTRVINSQTAKEVCLSDELGFLFHMMQIADGETCQATNFLRAFSQLPEASRLELLDKSTATAFVSREGSDKELLRRAQNLNRFVLEQMNKEMTGKDGGDDCSDALSCHVSVTLARKSLATKLHAVGSGTSCNQSESVSWFAGSRAQLSK